MSDRFKKWPDDPREWSADLLREHARAEGDAIEFSVDDYDWSYKPRMRLSELMSNVDEEVPMSPAAWREWYKEEKEDYELDRPNASDRFGLMENWYMANPADNPIVVVDDGDYWRLAGGHHRVGIAHTYRMTHVPAVVGRKKRA